MLLYIAGVRRSASTLAFQMASELVGESNRIRHWRERPKGVLTNKKTWWTVKGHGYVEEWEEAISNGMIEIFSTVRDPRDVVVSIMQLYGYPKGKKSSAKEVLDRGWVQKDISAQNKWRSNFPEHYTCLRYEDFHKSIHVLPLHMQSLMNIPKDTNVAYELAERFSYENNRERTKKQKKTHADLMFPKHVQTGMIDMWKYFLAPKEILMIQEELGEDWFRENGYKLWKE